MRDLTAIGKVCVDMGVNSRTLRHWEAEGLFKSERDAQSGWRVYGVDALQSIRVTFFLRRLDISINDIKIVLEQRTAQSLRMALKKEIARLEKTGADLTARKDALQTLIEAFPDELSVTLTEMENELTTISPMALERRKHTLQKIMGGLNVDDVKSKYDDVRILQLPPMRTAAFSCVGASPEEAAMEAVLAWMEKSGLLGTMRLFGYNTEPYPSADSPEYGFGFCACIPESIEIPAPLTEKRLPGGTYAVVSEYQGDPSFGWKRVGELLQDSEWEWAHDGGRPCLEEHIAREGGGFFIPLWFPVKKKTP